MFKRTAENENRFNNEKCRNNATAGSAGRHVNNIKRGNTSNTQGCWCIERERIPSSHREKLSAIVAVISIEISISFVCDKAVVIIFPYLC